MGFLSCYTLSDKVADGINVDAFECINVEDPSLTRIKRAVIDCIPLLHCSDKDMKDIAANSLTFLMEPPQKEQEDDTGILVAFNPEEWRLCYNANLYTLLDPCGTKGDILILVDKGSRNVLAKANENNVTLSVDAENKPVISKHRRASLLYSAVKGRLLQKELSKLAVPKKTASPKKRAKSAR